jgi:hypothetical protein
MFDHFDEEYRRADKQQTDGMFLGCLSVLLGFIPLTLTVYGLSEIFYSGFHRAWPYLVLGLPLFLPVVLIAKVGARTEDRGLARQFACSRARMEAETPLRALYARDQRLLPYLGDTSRTELPISGPPEFVRAVRQILGELHSRAPHRYAEVLRALPMAKFVAGDPATTGYMARSDGLFLTKGEDYSSFRYIFLHEVGHNVGRLMHQDNSEQFANDYANRVLAEIS